MPNLFGHEPTSVVIACADAGQPRRIVMSVNRTAPRNILLVEDNESVRETTADLLSLTGATVHVAASGHEASRFLETRDVDLVLTDLAMNDGDGNWLVAWIRGSARHRHTKVVITSAHAQDESVKAGLRAGADGYLVKPFAPERFIEAVQQFLQSAEAGGRATGA